MDKALKAIDYKKWGHVVCVAQFWIAGCVFFTEVINNALLYFTRSQGYGPDTILNKLFYYLLIPTVINFSLILICRLIVTRTANTHIQKYVLMICTTLICTNVAVTHYQFQATMVIFIVPILLSILYEDMPLSVTILVLSLIGQTIAVIFRGSDALYNKDIGPEAAIAYVFSIVVFIISKILYQTLEERKNELGKALVEVEKANASYERAKLSMKMLETLARAIDAKDKYTNGHSLRVSVYSTILAKNLGWDNNKVEMIRYEALLHDIGKIGVPDSVLNKPGKLTDAEFDIIKSHTLVGAEILRDMIAVPNAVSVAKFHHERYDGRGYPNHLKGEDIPINARIVGIADAYDAMSSDRVYRKALPTEVIRQELIKGRGVQFDPVLLDIFVQLLDDGKLNINTTDMAIDTQKSNDERIVNDIEQVIRNIADIEDNNQAVEFDKFYQYMQKISKRYNQSIEILSVEINSTAEDTSTFELEMAAKEVEASIRKNVRAVDIYYRYSDQRHIIIFLNAGKDNIDIITKRIVFDFNSKAINHFNLSFEIMEDISSINNPKIQTPPSAVTLKYD